MSAALISSALCGCGADLDTAVSDLLGGSSKSSSVSGNGTSTAGTASSAALNGSVSYEGAVISSVEVYNRTGKIQREDFYTSGSAVESGSAPAGSAVSGTSSGNGNGSKVSYSVEYTYDDSGHLISVKKNGGSLGSNTPIEACVYSGDNCTQKTVYDSYGSAKQSFYWTYDKKTGNLTKERIVSAVSGTGTGIEEITLYNEAGNAESYTYSAKDEFVRDEYGYDASGRLVTDNCYSGTDEDSLSFSETRSYAYDENGNRVRLIKRDNTDTVYYAEINEYTEIGEQSLITKKTVYSSDEFAEENMAFQYIYEYNDSGLISFEAYYFGTDSRQTYYEYNSAGKCTVKSETKYIDGKSVSTTVTTTEYDAQDNPVRETVKRPDGSKTVNYLCSYEYYSDGKIKSKTNYAV